MKIKRIICSLSFAAMIFSVYAISYGNNKTHEVADTYWSAVYNNDVIMSNEERIENSTMVLPMWVDVQFETSEEIDGKQFGYITIKGSHNNGKASASSEKNIVNGLYKNKIPMIKRKSGREDIKWYYYPSAEYSSLIFIGWFYL